MVHATGTARSTASKIGAAVAVVNSLPVHAVKVVLGAGGLAGLVLGAGRLAVLAATPLAAGAVHDGIVLREG